MSDKTFSLVVQEDDEDPCHPDGSFKAIQRAKKERIENTDIPLLPPRSYKQADPNKETRKGTVKALVKPFNATLRSELEELMKLKDPTTDKPVWTLGTIEKRTGIDKSQISQFVNGKPVGNVVKQEQRIAAFLHRELLRTEAEKHPTGTLFPTFVSHRIFKIAEELKKTFGLGGFISDPGTGKTSAMELYKQHDNLSVGFTLRAHLGGGTTSGVLNAFFNDIDTRGWDKKTARGKWLADEFRKSERIILVDNANRLTLAGLEWLLDFHDDTGCPLLLLGNVELGKAVGQVERGMSRFGHWEILKVKDSKGHSKFKDAAIEMFNRLWPDAASVIYKDGVELAATPGALRRLRVTIQKAKLMLGKTKELETPEAAFKAAQAMLPTWARLNAAKRGAHAA